MSILAAYYAFILIMLHFHLNALVCTLFYHVCDDHVADGEHSDSLSVLFVLKLFDPP